MAYRKFQLDERNRYQLLQAVYLSVKLIATAENEDDGPFEIGLEIQDAPLWDDVAVYPSDPTNYATEHWQIKFQTTSVEKSALEEMFRSASRLLSSKSNLDFRIGLPADVATGVGKALTMRKLEELCRSLQAPGNPGESAPEVLPDRSLQGWFAFTCETLDNDHAAARRLLERMRVELLGSPQNIIDRTNQDLRRWYLEPDQAREAIQNVLRRATPLSRIRFDNLAPILESIPRVGTRRPWISFRQIREEWWQRGTVSDKTPVSSIWSDDGGSPEVRIFARSNPSQRLGPALLRLVLHGSRGSTLSCTDRDGWRERARKYTGGTLGEVRTDIVDEVFVHTCERGSSPAIQPRSDQTVAEGILAENLETQMNMATWERITAAVRAAAQPPSSTAPHATTLMDEWTTFEKVLGYPSLAGLRFLHNTLRASFEPPHIRGDVRCGPRTVAIIANALLLLIMLRITFRDHLHINHDSTLDIDDIPVRTLALATCYNPDEACIDPILDHLRRMAFGGGILVLGGTETPVGGLYDLVATQLDKSFAQSPAPSLKTDQPLPDTLLAWGPDARHALAGGITMISDFIHRLVRHSSATHREKLTAILDAIRADEGDPDGGTSI